MTKFTSSATSHISVSMNKWNSTQHNILIGSVHFQFASFSILHVLLTLYEPFMPLSNICFLHNFWALCFRQHWGGFTCTPPSFRKNLKLIICSKLWLFILQWGIPTHTHTHTHTYTPLRIWAVCHTAKIDSTVGLAVQGVQKLTYKAQSPQYQVQHILVKRLKT